MATKRIPAILRRTTPTLYFTFWQQKTPSPDGGEPNPLDLTGATVTLSAKKSPDSSESVLFALSCNVDDAEKGSASVVLTTTATDRIGMVFCEVRAVFTSGPRAGEEHADYFQMPILEKLS